MEKFLNLTALHSILWTSVRQPSNCLCSGKFFTISTFLVSQTTLPHTLHLTEMNNHKRTSRQHKQIALAQKKLKNAERQSKYRLSRKKAWENDQKSFCRSRQAKFQNVTATDDEIKENRHKHRIRKHRSRALERQHESYDENERKRKAAFLRWSKCKEIYEEEIRQLYSHICNSCGKLCKKNQIRSLKLSTLKDKGYNQRFLNKIFFIKKSDCEEFCKTCISYIQKGNVPKMCLYNGLELPKVHDKISQLNRIEERLLAPRHVFQTLWTMNGGSGQYRTKGGIVNVPVDMDTTVSCIPRALSDSNMIHVKLARRMQYISNYMVGNVRPKLLYDAAQKFVQMPLPLEEGIELSENWNFPDCGDNFNDFDDEFYTNNAIFETLLSSDNIDFMGASNVGIRMAPAENYTPSSILFDENCEFLAFPTVFGGHKMEPEYNNKKISYTDFTKSLILRHDRRVAERGDLLLFMAKKLELLRLYNNIGICLRKKTVRNRTITAADMCSSNYVEGVVHHNDGYKILKGIRSSPAHWQQEKAKLMAQIRQFGLPSFFLTLSSADTRWPELMVALKKSVDKEIISEKEASELSSQERAKLLQKDPVTAALHFDQRFKAIQKTWKSPEGPFLHHKISHHYHRIEFQQRG